MSTTKSSDVLHVRIGRLLRRALKVKAAETGRPMRALVEEALRAYLKPRRTR